MPSEIATNQEIPSGPEQLINGGKLKTSQKPSTNTGTNYLKGLQGNTKLRSLLLSPYAINVVGSPAAAFPETFYTQKEVGEILHIKDPVTWRLLKAPHIQKRHLYLPKVTEEKRQPTASDREATFMNGLEDIGVKAVKAALANNNMDASQVDLMASVTSTNLALPGVTGILMKEIDSFRDDCQRMDIVGMGCNGGLSGLRNVATSLGHLASIRGKKQTALLLCCEINSAYFVNRDITGDGVVNSLFGDGAVALLLSASPMGGSESSGSFSTPSDSAGVAQKKSAPPKMSVVDFESLTIPEYFEDMKYNMDEDSQLPFFTLSKRIPQAVGSAVEFPVRALLDRHGLAPSDISQWVVHGGGKAVMHLVAEGLGLNHDHDLRHTISVIRDYGNISSGSFLVSLNRLFEEAQKDMKIMREGDLVVLIAMGPGATIEAALGVVTAGAQIKETACCA